MPLAIVLLLTAVWTAYWFFASTYARKAVEEGRARLAQSGMALTCGRETWGGFPFRFEFTCTAPALIAHGIAAIQPASIEAVAQAYYPWHILLLIDGPTRITSASGVTLAASHKRALASFLFRDSTEPEFSMEVPELDVPGILSARSVMIFTRPEGNGKHGLAITIKDVHHRRPGKLPLDVGQANLLGTLKSARSLQVDGLTLQQGTVTWSGEGEIGLDHQFRVSGLLRTQTNDLDGLLAILDPHIEMTGTQRQAFRAVLGLLGQRATADVIAKDGELFIGPFKIADLLPLN